MVIAVIGTCVVIWLVGAVFGWAIVAGAKRMREEGKDVGN